MNNINNKIDINKFICFENDTIVSAMSKIDSNSKGIIFVINSEMKLVGVMTDGDIRRWLLKEGKLTEHVSFAMNKKPIFIYNKYNNKNEINDFIKKMQVTAVPLLSDNDNIIDIYFLNDVDHIKNKKMSLNGVPVVIMAGGKGTRLYPYTKILPKPLIPIGDTPIVERIINYYVDFGVDTFYMTVNYKKLMIKSYFDDTIKNYNIKYVEEDKPLGTGGSIKLIKDKFDKPIFVTNCDALIIAEYDDIYDFHIKSKNDITMVSALKNFVVPYGVIKTGENGVIKSMEEKPTLSYFINTGMYIINPETINLIPDNQVFHMTHLVEKVLSSGGKVSTYPVSEASFLDMGEFDEMKRMEEKLNLV